MQLWTFSQFLLSTSPIFQAWKPQGVPWPKQQDPWPAISWWFTRNMESCFFLSINGTFFFEKWVLVDVVDIVFSMARNHWWCLFRFIDCIGGLRYASSGDVPEGEQETARIPGERVRQGPTGVSAAFSCGSWSTVSLFHIKNPATIKAYYNQCIFTGHIHWVSLISSHSGWGLKTIQDHMNPFN